LIRIRFVFSFVYFYIIPLSAFELNGSVEAPPLLQGVPLDVYQISSLSGFLLGPLTSADVTLLHFTRFKLEKRKAKIRRKGAREWERREGTTERKEDEVETSYEG